MNIEDFTLVDVTEDYVCSMDNCREVVNYKEVQMIDKHAYCPSCYAEIQDMGRPYIEEPSY